MENSELENLKEKLFSAIDPNSDYSYEDFMNEYGQYKSELTEDDLIPFILNLNYVNTSDNPDPEYATEGASGFDLRASEDYTLESNNYGVVPTGLFFEIPPNFEIQVRPRSGLAAKYGVTVLNSPGTIDYDYRGEIKVILINHGKEVFEIKKGDRIAQAVIAQVAKNYVNLNKVKKISENTLRNAGGFGSTGIK